jgi:hypothetical protein
LWPTISTRSRSRRSSTSAARVPGWLRRSGLPGAFRRSRWCQHGFQGLAGTPRRRAQHAVRQQVVSFSHLPAASASASPTGDNGRSRSAWPGRPVRHGHGAAGSVHASRVSMKKRMQQEE